MDAVKPSRRSRLAADIAAECLPSWKAVGVRGKDVKVRRDETRGLALCAAANKNHHALS